MAIEPAPTIPIGGPFRCSNRDHCVKVYLSLGRGTRYGLENGNREEAYEQSETAWWFAPDSAAARHWRDHAAACQSRLNALRKVFYPWL